MTNLAAPATPVSSTPEASPGPSPENILKLGTAFWASKTLLSAVELELFTHLAAQKGTVEELQKRLGLHARSTRDFLDALVALGFLERESGVYANTAETDLFLDKRKPSYIGGILEMANARLYPFWAGLTDGLKTGQPQNEIKHNQDHFFHTLYADPARLCQFLKA